MEQLVYIVQKVKNDVVSVSDKLFEWSERRFETKMMNKVSTEIVVKQVELSTLVKETKILVVNGKSLLAKLCSVELFTEENQHLLENLKKEISATSQSLTLDPDTITGHYVEVMQTQGKLAELMANDGKIHSCLLSIQAILTPHLEAIQRKLTKAHKLIQSDPHLSTTEGLVNLATNLEGQIEVLQLASTAWMDALHMVTVLH